MLNVGVSISSGRILIGLDRPHNENESGIGDEIENTNFFWTVFNLWNDVLSAGCVAFPFYVRSTGLWAFPGVVIVFAILTGYTLDLSFYLSKKYKSPSLPSLSRLAFGRPGYILSCFFMFIFNFGGLVGSLIILGDIIPRLYNAFGGPPSSFARHNWILIYCSSLLLPMNFAQKISNLTFNSFVSMVSIVGVVIVVFISSLIDKSWTNPLSQPILHNRTDVFSFFSAFGGLSYSFVCHDISFNVFSSMKNNTTKRWRIVIVCVLVLTVLSFFLIGYGGFIQFRDDTGDDILENFNDADVIANVGRIFLCINILLSIPYSCFMPRVSIYSIYTLYFGQPNKPWKNHLINLIITLFVSGIAFALSELIDDLGKVYELVGAISAAGMAFILPPAIFLVLEEGSFWSARKLKQAFVLFLGVLILLTASGSVIVQMVYDK
ncbi:hypothetical protein PROFUN_10611 [Planoprotostelium fungivorum]|uniref:Amino acid transporter transmembrane domain-containing protein n=1 Tax=Planoprotostelium fungivorum TaxID=1890364 RepID=A0A2P6ND67_9EUKA|nr:hypothetical protein PROFUN_10611 [Planoprotostelium fungivorum]